MRRTKWQFSLFLFILSTLFILIVNASAIENEKRRVDPITTTTATTTTKHHRKHHHTKHHHTKHHHSRKHHHNEQHSSLRRPRATTTINNCSLASIQHHNSLRNKKLPRTQTVYVCHKTKTTTTKHHVKTTTKQRHHKNKSHSKKKTTTTTKHHRKPHTTTSKHHSKPHTTTKHHEKPAPTTTTTTTTHVRPSPVHKLGETSSSPIADIILPTSTPVSNNDNNSNISDNSSNDSSNNNSNDNSNDSSSSNNNNNNAVAASLPTPSTDASSSVSAASFPPAITTLADNNNQVNAQSVDNNNQTTDAQPQSKVIGVSIGAVVGCIAAAGLVGMFVYKRREKSSRDHDVEEMEQTSEVNTRWRTQSFMAVVAGAVAKLPKRNNSTASTNGRSSFNVLGSIRRTASNASRSLSRSLSRASSTRSSVQSYGIAFSGPPPIARIDGDQAQYYGEPQSPTSGGGHHTHAY